MRKLAKDDFMRFKLPVVVIKSLLIAGIAGMFSIVLPATIILTSDKQLNDLLDPDKKIDLSTGRQKEMASLREICESARRSGDKILTIAFDEFFRQYREQAGTERKLTPDQDEYIKKIKVISDFAARYKLGIGLSLLSPLESGPAFKQSTGEAGRWLNYKVGYRDPVSGKFSLAMWQQLSWSNNKGKFRVGLKGVRAFAFREVPVANSPFKAVSPADIIELTNVLFEGLDTIKTIPSGEMWVEHTSPEARDMFFESRHVRIYHEGGEQCKGFNRVMVLLEYETDEMDYFSPQALPFLKKMLDKYQANGINLTSLYSDEMHIQQDWYYFIHHENGQFNVRYLTKAFSEKYRQKFGQELSDKYLLYFVYGAPLYKPVAKAVRNVQYVLGAQPEEIHRTFLLRDRYYTMLNQDVTNLYKDAKNYAEALFGRKLETHGHASWAESPTIDLWDTEKLRENAAKYEYTSNYVWGNTVQQAAAACYDYFKWGEYLEPTGNDFAECGWLDRNYFGAAMAASLGVINKYPVAYDAAWGMPEKSRIWKQATNSAFGAVFGSNTQLITGRTHRDIEVLILYPMNLVAVEERFGSWMSQYAYANYLTAGKLLELGKVTDDGFLKVLEKKYNTLVAVFEPLPMPGLLELMHQFTAKGGTIIWCGPPPLLDARGNPCGDQWQQLFGTKYSHDQYMGEIAAGKKITFKNGFAGIPEQTILTDFLVDRIYPVVPVPECEVLAQTGKKIVGTRLYCGKGTGYFMGFRPRDDQSASLGYESRTLFEILNAAGSYRSSGKFPGFNDHPACISRNTETLATRFPNGSVVIVKHYRTHSENWDGGFSRNDAKDEIALSVNPLPSDTLVLQDLKIDGHQLTYTGRLLLAFRTDSRNRLMAFEGYNCSDVLIDGFRYAFAPQNFEAIIFAPDEKAMQTYWAILSGQGKINLPIPLVAPGKLKIYSEEKKNVPFKIVDCMIELEVTPAISGKKLRIVW